MLPYSPTLIIGGGQAGLATACYLQARGIPCTLLEKHEQVGDSWRLRWDSLKLFSPAKYSCLPGRPFAGDPMHMPTKDEVADYQAALARECQLDIRLRHHVEALEGNADGFALQVRNLESGTVSTWTAKHVVVAIGAFATPFMPSFAHAPASLITQLHVAQYRRPGDLPDGPVLVVGTGASGTQIAAELSATRKVYLSRPEIGHMPRRLLGKDFYWWLYATGAARVKRDSWIGRRYLRSNSMGDALIGMSLKQIVAQHGLIRRGMLVDFEAGLPVFDDGKSAEDIVAILWATGYRNDYGWIRLPILDASGQPIHKRGVVATAPGLYFVGMKFLYQGHSSNLGGVGEDAEFIAEYIAKGASG